MRRASNKSGPHFPLPTNTGTSRILRENRAAAPQGAPDPLPPSLRYSPAPRLLKARHQGYGSALAFHLANALFQTACRFDELIQLSWADCQRVGEEIVALRIKGKGSVFQDVPVPARLSHALLEWKGVQEAFRDAGSGPRRDRLRGVAVCVCGVFRGSVLEPGVQFAAAGGLQSPRGGGDHSPWAASQRGDDPP